VLRSGAAARRWTQADAETSRRFHDAMLGAKAQVVAQYRNDSLAVEAIGLTRKSERRRPVRRRAMMAD
jgi:hypothetical protein